jgi:beta-lactamase superfamily II metal-dependent hydrolase
MDAMRVKRTASPNRTARPAADRFVSCSVSARLSLSFGGGPPMRSRFAAVPCALVLSLFLAGNALCQQLSYLPLQQPGQASVAVDRAKRMAFVFDLGSDRDGREINFEGKPLLVRLEELGVEHIVFTCSHPHSDHMGGIRALFSDANNFVKDGDKSRPRFKITLVDDGVTTKLRDLLTRLVAHGAQIHSDWRSARSGNAFAGLSSREDAVFVESIPYTPVVAAGPHGRSVVTKITLEGGHTVLDFDDADNAVVAQVARTLKATNVRIDTFVVPHHGSRFGDIEPILALNPRRAVIAVNRENRYGHPGGHILAALIDRLGPDNVYFTGSGSATVFGRDGVISKAHTAAQRDSYALFVQEAHTRAKRRKDSQAEVAAYERVRSGMLSDRGILPPDMPPDPTSIPPKGPNDGPPDAFTARIQERGTMHTPAFEIMHVRAGGSPEADVRSHRAFGTGDPSRTSTRTDTTTPHATASRQRSQRQANEHALRNAHITGTTLAGPILATAETAAGVPSSLEASFVMTAPQAHGSLATPPRGGMVFLTGGTVHVAGNASELFGGTLDLCNGRICVRPLADDGAPYILPIAAGSLFGEVWHRVAERRVESFYLSINPTKSFLNALNDDDVPVQKLAFGHGPVAGHANEVVTAGDIERSEIGRILWESDVAFKSASLGFDVLSGATPLSSHGLSLIQLDDATRADTEVDPQNRWCRLYWSSGAQSLAIDRQTRRVSLRGKAVLAQAEPMILRNGELTDHKSGTWCSGAKQTAAVLEKETNAGLARFPVLNRLRELAELQTFVKWARDNGLTLAAPLAKMVDESRADLQAFAIPKWTSGIRSNPTVLVQQQTTGTSAQPSRLVHVSAADTTVFATCVIPEWERQNTEFPAAGVERQPNGWRGGPPGFLTRWMSALARRIAECSRGRLLPPTSLATIDPLADHDTQLFGIKRHLQPMHVHGGVLLGTRRHFLQSAWRDDGLLRTPDGMIAFKRVDDELHFWNFLPTAGGVSGLGQHVVVHGGKIIDATVDEGSLRFVLSVEPHSLIREELRIARTQHFSAGLEWAKARHGSDGSVILEKLAWRCGREDVSCVGVADVSFEQLGKLLQAGAPTDPILTVTHLDGDAWAVTLDVSRLHTWFQQQWAQSRPTDTSARLMLVNGMAQWGFESAADDAREDLIEEIDVDSADTILSAVLTHSSATLADFFVAFKVEAAQNELDDTLDDRTASEALAALRRIERTIEPLPATVSALLYDTQGRLCERLRDEKNVLAATRKELDDMLRRVRHATHIRRFLAAGTPSPWREGMN